MNMIINFYSRCICVAVLLSLAGHSALAQSNIHLVKELNPGTDDTFINEMKVIDGHVYFTDLDNGLMRTDGTAEGTISIENGAHFWYTNYTPTAGGFYYRIQNWFSNYWTIGKTNGEVEASTIANHSFVSVSELTEMNGIVYFIADDGVYGSEIWKSDGITATMVKDVRSGNPGSNPHDLRVCNGMLFFVADDQTHGAELWKTDGTDAGTVMVKDIWGGGSDGYPSIFEELNNELYFRASNGVNGIELWKTDGTANGTIMVKDIATGSTPSVPAELTKVGDVIYFEAYDDANGRALWKTGGTEETTTFVKDIHPATDTRGYISDLTEVNGTLYFSVNYDLQGMDLWKLDATAAVILKQIKPGSADDNVLKNFSSVNNHLFFVAAGQLWKTDGALCNTVQLTSADGISYMDWLPHVVMVDDKLFFQGTTSETGGELYYYDYSNGGPKGICIQTIEFADIEQKTFGDEPFVLNATASSELPVTFSSSDPGIVSINESIATIKKDGEVTITATQAGDIDTAPASAQKTIIIQRRIITAVEPERPSKVSVYPNPVVKDLMLEGFSPNEHVLVKLYRADGKAILAEDLSGKANYQLDVSSLIPGIYIVNITSGNRNHSERIIKN